MLYLWRRAVHKLQGFAIWCGVGPPSPTPLTSEWVARHCDGLEGEVRGEMVLTEGGENGAVSRVTLSSGTTAIVKRPPASEAARAVAAVQQWYAREVHWYACLAGAAAVRCPRCHAAVFDATTGGFALVLEDLAAAGFGPLGERDLVAAAAALGRLHGAFYAKFDGPGALDRGPLPVMPVTLELVGGIQGFFRSCWAAVRGDARYAPHVDVSLVDALAAEGAYARLTKRLAAPPRTLLHGDFRAENLFSDGAGAIAVYDWQFASLGNGAYDLAYFCGLAAEPERRRALDAVHFAAYLEAVAAAGAAPPTNLKADVNRAVLLALASFVMGAATAGNAPASVATHQRGLRRLSAAAAEWGARRALDDDGT